MVELSLKFAYLDQVTVP